MAKIQQLFLRKAKEAWQREFPFLRPVDLKINRLPKGASFLCDNYFATRRVVYFLTFEFNPRRIGEFTISVTVSPSATSPIVDSTGPFQPSPTQPGSYLIGAYFGRPMYGWALINGEEETAAFFRSIGEAPPNVGMVSKQDLWRPVSFDLPPEEIVKQAIADINQKLRQFVFSILQIG